MINSRVVIATTLAGPALVALANGCAFITCVEDDCADLAAGGASSSASAGGGGGASSATIGSAVSAGGGGEGGGDVCTTHCTTGDCKMEACQPVCSPLPGSGRAIATRPDAVFAIAESGTPGLGVVETVGIADFGLPTTNVGGGELVPDKGHLAAAELGVYFAVEQSMRLVGGAGCSTGWAQEVVAAAEAGEQTFWAVGSTIEAWTECKKHIPVLDVPNGPVAIDAVVNGSGARVAYLTAADNVCSALYDQAGQVVASGCFTMTFPEATSVALTPDAMRIVVAAGQDVWSGSVVSTAAALFPRSVLAKANEVAATSTAYFVSREAPKGEGTLLRCPSDTSAGCQSFGDQPIAALRGQGEAVYFTMGDQLCV